MGYCCYMTQAGYALQAKLFAEGGNFNITRVMIGSGRRSGDTPPQQLTGLVEPRGQAASTEPVRAECDVSLIIEWRSDMIPELEAPFQITEFGVFATGADGDEVLALWADMTTCPDTAVPQKYGGCVRRWPVNITIGPDASVSLSYPAGAWLTREEALEVIREGLEKGLDMGDGTTVPQAVAAMREDLEQTKETLGAGLDEVRKALDGSDFYRVFEPSEWQENELRIPAAEHGMEPRREPVVFTLRQRIGRTAYEYDADAAAPVAGLLIAAVKEALAANAAVPGAYPTAEDGHVILTWEQVQYLLLESTFYVDREEGEGGEDGGEEAPGQTVWTPVLVSAEEAAAKAVEEGFTWRDRDNGTAETVTLDGLLAAAYLPALGGPSASFEVMVTAEALQGLRFRRGAAGNGFAAKYDLDGHFTVTWGTLGCEVVWDMAAKDLVVRADGPFAGDILVMGRANTGG